MKDLKEFLDYHYNIKNSNDSLFSYPDPLQIASKFKDVHISLMCALFSYGNAKAILKFLNSLEFDLLNQSEEYINKFYKDKIYRFQNSNDVKNIFITFLRMKKDLDIQEIILKGFKKNNQIIDGINELIKEIYKLNSYKSDGYEFYFGKSFDDKAKSPYKRYNMFLRWMVRDKDIDLGLFKKLNSKDLLIPLDVHTHKISLKLGLLDRKTYDFRSVCLLTEKLREFDKDDPIKYDFALYRISQLNEFQGI